MAERIARAYLGLGSNLGDRLENLRRALGLLSGISGLDVACISNFYETDPEYFLDQPEFINCAAGIDTRVPPEDLLMQTSRIERLMGRRPGFRYGPRVIDIDILVYGSAIIRKEELCVPHPKIEERLFVLFPLAQIAPGLEHPVSGLSVGRMLVNRIKKTEAPDG